MKYPLPENEQQRLEALETYRILDTISEREYDNITFLTAHICNTKISTIAFIDQTRKWHKAKYGINKESVPRETAICAHTIMGTKLLIVNDTLEHQVFSQLGMVKQPPHVRFYAGVPLLSSEGLVLGTLCAIDTSPKQLNDVQIKALEALAHSVESLLEARKNLFLLAEQKTRLQEQQKNVEKLNHELDQLSRTDPLTGLWNRRVQDEVLTQELNKHRRYPSPLGLIIFDIDNFKLINDQHGHELGDQVLVLLADVLKKHTRNIDYCIRYGGDEFIMILPNTQIAFIKQVSERIRREISLASQKLLPITVSIGAIAVKNQTVSHEELLNEADKCLYLAKSKGRDRIEAKSL